MKVVFLGTGTSQGVPLIGCRCEVCVSLDKKDNRLRSSILVQIEGINLVIDSGPDFRQQMLNVGIDRLDALIFTHAHKDHIAGLDDIRGFNFVMRSAIDVYCTLPVEMQIRQEFAYIFAEHKYPGIPDLNIRRIENKPFEIDSINIIPIEVMHYKLPVLGFRFKDFVYITDANYISPDEKLKMKGCKVLVLNALRREPHISHFTLDEAIELVQEIYPQQAYLTHISHQLGLHEEVTKELPSNISLAYDGLEILMD